MSFDRAEIISGSSRSGLAYNSLCAPHLDFPLGPSGLRLDSRSPVGCQERQKRIAELKNLRSARRWTTEELAELGRIAPSVRELLDCDRTVPPGDPTGILTSTQLAGSRSARPPILHDPEIEFVTWREERMLAGLSGGDWLIRDRLEFGAVSMLAAAPKGGKSTLVMALYAAIAKGTDFFGLPIQRVPILNIDPENRPRFRVERFDRASGFDDGDAQKLYLRPREIPDPLTVDYLQRAILKASDRTGHAKGLVVIDTLRTAFLGDRNFNERDANSMGRILGGLRKCAERTGWSILILHHTAKKTASFYGSVAIAGAVDYLWTLAHDERSRTSTLSIKGRGDVVEDMQFTYNVALQRLELSARPISERDAETQEILDLLGLFPWDRDKAITTGEFREALEKSDAENNSKSFAESRVRKLSSSGWLDQDGVGTKSSPRRYWISDEGQKFLATAGEIGLVAGEEEEKVGSEAVD